VTVQIGAGPSGIIFLPTLSAVNLPPFYVADRASRVAGVYSSHAIIRSIWPDQSDQKVTAAETTPIKLTVVSDYV
jgi:cation diffusion facilitator CzcD-associated flavoprotein CzcO